MNITPQLLLKRLKPTPKFKVTDKHILALAELAIEEGAATFVETWQDQFAKIRSAPRAKSNNSVQDPHLSEAIAILKGFASSRNLKAKEMAFLFTDLVGSMEGVPKPNAKAQSSIPASVRWSSTHLQAAEVPKIAKSLVAKYSDETNYTYT